MSSSYPSSGALVTSCRYDVDVVRSNESGRHDWNRLFVRNVVMNVIQPSEREYETVRSIGIGTGLGADVGGVLGGRGRETLIRVEVDGLGLGGSDGSVFELELELEDGFEGEEEGAGTLTNVDPDMAGTSCLDTRRRESATRARHHTSPQVVHPIFIPYDRVVVCRRWRDVTRRGVS